MASRKRVLLLWAAVVPVVSFSFAFSGAGLGAATWARTYGGLSGELVDLGADTILELQDGNLVLIGNALEPGGGGIDPWVLKTDASGGVLWEMRYPGPSDEYGRAIQETSDGGLVIAGGPSTQATAGRAWILKLDASGAVEWGRAYGGTGVDHFLAVRRTEPDGGYVAVGGSSSFGSGDLDLWVVKTDASGTVEWEKTYDTGQDEAGFAVRQATPDGGFIVAGLADRPGGATDGWVLKIDGSGGLQWEAAFGAPGGDAWFASVEQSGDGGYVLAGATDSFGQGDHDLWVVRLEATGVVRWQKVYGGSNSDAATSIRWIPPAGGFLVAGTTTSYDEGVGSVWSLRIAGGTDGAVAWQRRYGGPGEEQGGGLALTSDGGSLVLGQTESWGSGASDLWVLRLDGTGLIMPACPYIEDTALPSENSTAQAMALQPVVNESTAMVTVLSPAPVVTAASVEEQCPGGATLPPEPGGLTVTREADLVSLTFEMAAGADTYNGYSAELGEYYMPRWSFCWRDPSNDPDLIDNGDGTATWRSALPPGSVWFLVSASNVHTESSLGWATGWERDEPPSMWRCGANW